MLWDVQEKSMIGAILGGRALDFFYNKLFIK
jgi:hypothetical protein